MKAKELAELLLKTPDLDVFIQEMQCDRDGDYYYTASTIDGVLMETPSGIFLANNSLGWEETIKKPSDIPPIGEARIKLNEEKTGFDYFPVHRQYASGDTDLETGWFWTELQNEGHYYSYQDYDTDVVLQSADKPYEHYNDYDAFDTVDFTDIEYVEVRIGINPDWSEVWEQMSFEEAIQYFKKRQEEFDERINNQNN